MGIIEINWNKWSAGREGCRTQKSCKELYERVAKELQELRKELQKSFERVAEELQRVAHIQYRVFVQEHFIGPNKMGAILPKSN